MKLTAKNHEQLEDLIDKIIVTPDTAEVSQQSAQGALAYLVRIDAEGEDAELKSWLENPETFQNWWRGASI